MKNSEDPYRLKDKSDTELHEWMIQYKPGTAEYIAGIQESMSRIAVIEELIEKNDKPVRKRELIAMFIAIMALAVAIFVIVNSYQ